MSKKIYPEPVVGALTFNQEGKVFLMKSPKWRGKYSIAGGHIELGETMEEAIKREIKEETDLDIFDIQFFVAKEFIFGKEFYKKKHFIFLDYICKTKDTKVTLDEKEGTEYVWVTINEALKLPLASSTRNIISEYKNRFLGND